MEDVYFTIDQSYQGLFKDRGSKFISYLFPVENEDMIKQHLLKLKKENPGAVHFCYAFVLGKDYSKTRANDDGEPSGTAGKPILMQLQAKQLTNVLLVVVRYFGGTLLGTGGLINAYRNSAADALTQCSIITKQITELIKISFSPDATGIAHLFINKFNGKLIDTSYSNDAVCLVEFNKSKIDLIKENISNYPQLKID